MANDTSKVVLPKSVVTTLLNKVRDTSTIAALSPSASGMPSRNCRIKKMLNTLVAPGRMTPQ